ncbi:CDP-glycerol glycerophosphotransferase family protein [Paucisalibacillus globulus]|uniref:CDP-glycerol glycerophosphotransferase family protein n=1 Tax=Paucisalibacillus globulus TaxID=351095 RepID=UPI0020D1752C|nr:CDP-glycerol glycerophosphotransferase family protein [Paucisalibacillus globulus]
MTTIVPFTLIKPLTYLKSIFHLATASTILVDNYFGFLAVTKFKKETKCIQLWHAAGAIKKFGFQKPTTENRSTHSHKRFAKVYSRFNYTIVGSERMATIFQDSFGLTDDRILRTGIPRTDFFYSKRAVEKVHQQLITTFPITREKKVILYAPTFRDHSLSGYHIRLDIEKLYKELANDYVLFIKAHPAVTCEFNAKHKEFVYDVSDYYDVNHLLLCTDILITDYSSIPFEFALLEKPMIFYAYDIDEYKDTSGLIDDFDNQMPGPIVRTTEDIIKVIIHQDFQIEKIKPFSEEWNQYSVGRSSINLSQIITESKR